MLPVTHASAPGKRMYRLGPCSGGCSQFGRLQQQIGKARVSRPQQGLGQIEGQIDVHPGMDHILKETTLVETMSENEFQGVHDPVVAG